VIIIVSQPIGLMPTDTVMTLNDIFTHIFAETGWIWTKLGRGMWSGKRVTYKTFSEIAPGAPDKEAKY